jgi:hypothetical protein
VNLNLLLLALDMMPPAALLLIWAGMCVGAVALGLTIAAQLQGPSTDPFAALPKTPSTLADSDADQIGDLSDRSQARHGGAGMASWRPQHTAATARRRGRHFTGDRRWSGNLLEETQACELTADDLEASR